MKSERGIRWSAAALATALFLCATLIGAMKQSYPQVTEGAMSLDIGAKVNTGEMKW